MNITLRLFTMLISILVVVSVVLMLIKRKLNESNSILWLLIAFVTLVIGFFPDILTWLADFVGISYAPSLLFLLSILFLVLITFKGSLQLSKIDAKINELVIELSILKEENRRLSALTEDKGGYDCEDA